MSQPVQSLIEQAISANGPTIVAATAANVVRQAEASAIRVTQNLSTQQFKELERCCPGVSLMQDPRSGLTAQHGLIAAARDIARSDIRAKPFWSDSEKSVLIVGASSWEVTAWLAYDGTDILRANGSKQETSKVCFQFADVEGKDGVRYGDGPYRQLLRRLSPDVAEVVRRKTKSYDKSGVRPAEAFKTSLCMAAAGQADAARFRFGQCPEKGAYEPNYGRADVVVGFDVGYNFNKTGWARLFEDTGAHVGYFTMLMPWELLWPDMVAHDWYRYRVVHGGGRKHGVITGDHGESMYSHPLEDWGTLVRTHYIQTSTGVLQVEACARYGPMINFAIWHAGGAGPQVGVREYALPEHMRYVRVLDLEASVDRDGNMNQLVYFPVLYDEAWYAINFGTSVKDEGLSFAGLQSYINKMAPGMMFSGATGGIARWRLQRAQFEKLALLAYVYALLKRPRTKEVLAAAHAGDSAFAAVVRALKRGVYNAMTLGMGEFIAWLLERNLRNKLVVEVDGRCAFTQGVIVPRCATRMADVEEVFCLASGGDDPELPPEAASGGGSSEPAGVSHNASCDAPDATDGASNSTPAEPAGGGRCAFRSTSEPLLWPESALQGRLGKQRLSRVGAGQKRHKFRLELDESGESDSCPLLVRLQEEATHDAMEGRPQLADLLEAVRRAGKAVRGEEHECDFYFVQAGPGTGKTHLAKSLFTHESVYVAPLSALRRDFAAEVGKRCDATGPNCTPYSCSCHIGTAPRAAIYTHHRACEARLNSQGQVLYRGTDTLFIDEAVTLDADMMTLLVLLYRPERVMLLGDFLQYECRADQGKPISAYFGFETSREMLKSFPHITMHVNFRNPPAIVAWCNAVHGYDMEAASTFEGPAIRIVSMQELGQNAPDRDAARALPWMCARTAGAMAADGSSDEGMSTVRATQGLTHTRACWYITAQCVRTHLAMVGAGQIVAMTRCRETLTIVTDGSNAVQAWLDERGISGTNFECLITAFGPPLTAREAAPPAVAEIEERHCAAPVGCDAFRMATELIPPAAAVPGADPFNMPSSEVFRNEVTRLAIQPEQLVAPISANGRSIPLSSTAQVVAQCVGTCFVAGNPGQTANVIAVRYAGQSKKMGPEGKALATEIARHYREVAMQPVTELSLTQDEMMDVVCKIARDHCAKGADTAINGVVVGELDFVAHVELHLKTITKPSTSGFKIDLLDKVGQGICVWAKAATLRFNFIARCIERIMQKYQRQDTAAHITTDDGKSEEAFIAEISDACARLKGAVPCARWKTTDGVMFDSQQNEFTQEVEKALWSMLGIPEHIIEQYYFFRRDYTIKARGLRARGDCAKTSGEGWTKGGNGWVARALSMYVLRPRKGFSFSPYVAAYKGDDFAILGNHEVDEQRLTVLREHTALELRVNCEGPGFVFPDFCGMVLVEGRLIPSIARRFLGAVSKRFADYEHFALYQESIRNFNNLIGRLTRLDSGLNPVNLEAKRLGVSTEQVLALQEVLISIGHIDQRQYASLVQTHTLVPTWLGGTAERPLVVRGYDVDLVGAVKGDDEIARAQQAVVRAAASAAARERAYRDFERAIVGRQPASSGPRPVLERKGKAAARRAPQTP